MEPSRSAADPTRPSSDEGNDAKGILRVEVPADAPLYEAVRHVKRELITRALEAARGNRSEAARRLGIQRTYLHRLIRELEIRVPGRRGRADRPGAGGETP